MANQRSESLRRRLTKSGNEEMAAKYREVMDGYINKGFARKLSEEELTSESDTCWDLPHHPVTNPTKPGKMRIVFDAAAEYNGTSLNKNLIHGPDMTNNLVAVLLRFRQGKIGIAADVEGMFHQIRVRKEDQDSLRFLWWTNSYDEPPDVYVMRKHQEAHRKSMFLELHRRPVLLTHLYSELLMITPMPLVPVLLQQ